MSPGRPPKPPDQKRTEYVGLRVTRLELVRLYAVAKVLRMDVSEYLRLMALGEVKYPS